jgi:VanZ family protein
MHFCCALMGWPIGCCIALSCKIEGGSATNIGVAALFSIAGVMSVLYGLVPFQLGQEHGSISFGPFFGHFGSRVNDAFMDISGDVLRYGMIAGLIAVASMQSRTSWRLRSAIVVCTVVVTAAIIEYLHLYIPFRHADMTSAYLALFGGCCAAVAVRWAIDYRASSVVVAEDALTCALIDGPTYDKSRPAGVKPGSRRSDASRTDREESRPQV